MNYTFALETAVTKFQQMNLEEISRCSGYSYDEGGIWVDFLGTRLYVNHPTGVFDSEMDIAAELPVFAKILILHYLTGCREIQEVKELISFKELPGGMIYAEPFSKRSINPFVKFFGSNPERFLAAALKLGGTPLVIGDAAAVINVFPRIPVTLVLWSEDEEFPASGNILFDKSAPLLLETEDYAVLASILVGQLIKLAKD